MNMYKYFVNDHLQVISSKVSSHIYLISFPSVYPFTTKYTKLIYNNTTENSEKKIISPEYAAVKKGSKHVFTTINIIIN